MSIAIFAASAATALAVGASVPASSADATGPAWAGEARYWSDEERADFGDYIQLFSDRFTGWPCRASLPQAKSDLKGPIKGLQPGTVLDRKSTVVGPGLVITYYRATWRFQGDAGKIETVVNNITHTWIPTAEGWKIIGGMCRIAPAE